MPSVLFAAQGETVAAMMVPLALLAAGLAFVIGVWAGDRYGHAHVMDDGTDRYEIIPYRKSDDKVGVNRTTVYRCQKESCRAEETDETHIKDVHRDEFEDALDTLDTYHPRM